MEAWAKFLCGSLGSDCGCDSRAWADVGTAGTGSLGLILLCTLATFISFLLIIIFKPAEERSCGLVLPLQR